MAEKERSPSGERPATILRLRIGGPYQEAPSVVNYGFRALIFHDFGLDHFIYSVPSY